MFQSTRPRGARPPMVRRLSAKALFQSTRPRGARRSSQKRHSPRFCFNPRARVGRDFRPSADPYPSRSFNPRARVGRDLIMFSSSSGSSSCFNPRARVGRDLGRKDSFITPKSFNPRARVGRDHGRWQSNSRTCKFQSTRPRGARQLAGGKKPEAMRVSIHAPAWGATLGLGLGINQSVVSIHAPAWGATFFVKHFVTVNFCFNPRARVGRDLECVMRAPVVRSFNPRARVGRDPLPCIASHLPPGFNPRARVGRDCGHYNKPKLQEKNYAFREPVFFELVMMTLLGLYLLFFVFIQLFNSCANLPVISCVIGVRARGFTFSNRLCFSDENKPGTRLYRPLDVWPAKAPG